MTSVMVFSYTLYFTSPLNTFRKWIYSDIFWRFWVFLRWSIDLLRNNLWSSGGNGMQYLLKAYNMLKMAFQELAAHMNLLGFFITAWMRLAGFTSSLLQFLNTFTISSQFIDSMALISLRAVSLSIAYLVLTLLISNKDSNTLFRSLLDTLSKFLTNSCR